MTACEAYPFVQLSNDILKPAGRIIPAQIKNYFLGQVWEKYEAVRERDEHTGGGDGDADRATVEVQADTDSEVYIYIDQGLLSLTGAKI